MASARREGNTPDTGQIPLRDKVPDDPGFVLYVMGLMGRTAGLVRRAGGSTAGGIVAAGRQAGRLVSFPLKPCSVAAKRMGKSQTCGVSSELDQLKRGLRDLNGRMEELERCLAAVVANLETGESEEPPSPATRRRQGSAGDTQTSQTDRQLPTLRIRPNGRRAYRRARTKLCRTRRT